MKYNEQTEEYTLDSGRIIYANKGLLSLHADGTVYDGYDSMVGRADIFTMEEKREIADEMIRRWSAWRND